MSISVDPAGEYYEDYYAVYFLDPDGIKLEGALTYGTRHLHGAREEGMSVTLVPSRIRRVASTPVRRYGSGPIRRFC